MKRFFTLCAIVLLALNAYGIDNPSRTLCPPHDDPCNIASGIYRTQTMGGWGGNCNGGNGNCIRDQYFAAAFPSGLLLGDNVTPGRHWMSFTSALAVKNYLPTGGTSHVLSHDYTNPSPSIEAGNFGGQLTALGMSIGMGILNPSVTPPFGDLRNLVIAHGPFTGRTVGDVYAIANQVLSGNTALLTLYDISLSNFGTVLTHLNENFDGGFISDDYVVMPNCNQLQVHCSMTVTAAVQELTCDNNVVAPNPFDIAVTVTNTGNISSNGIVVALNNGSGNGGTANVSPASITIGSLNQGASQTVHFAATGTFSGLNDVIAFAGQVISSDCNTYTYSAQVLIPQCTTIPSVCVPDAEVVLTPTSVPFPSDQQVYACARVSVVAVTQIIVPVVNPSNVPEVSVTSGCVDCGDANCDGLTAWSYDPQAWTFQTNPPAYVNTITANPNATGCCVCIHLDRILPVELNSFTATAGDNSVTLNWTTVSESNNAYFDIERNGEFQSRQTATNNPAGYAYSWEDNRVANGTTYSYTLFAVSANGARQELRSVNATPVTNNASVHEYVLEQNYPNPFNPSTQIVFSMKEAGWMKLTVYNLMGQEMDVLVNGTMSAGSHAITFDGADLPTGLYVYKMETNGFTAQQKMLLMK